MGTDQPEAYLVAVRTFLKPAVTESTPKSMAYGHAYDNEHDRDQMFTKRCFR